MQLTVQLLEGDAFNSRVEVLAELERPIGVQGDEKADVTPFSRTWPNTSRRSILRVPNPEIRRINIEEPMAVLNVMLFQKSFPQYGLLFEFASAVLCDCNLTKNLQIGKDFVAIHRQASRKRAEEQWPDSRPTLLRLVSVSKACSRRRGRYSSNSGFIAAEERSAIWFSALFSIIS